MTTAIASGLGATWGVNAEVTPGTFLSTGMRWMPFLTDKMQGAKKTVQSQAIHGALFEMATRRRLVMHEAKGPVELDLQTRQLGLLLKHMIGSTAAPVQQGATTAYLQQHVPGDLTGYSLSLQSGRPVIGGTIQAFSYNGCKITDWEILVQTDGLAKLIVTFDGWDEAIATAYAAPSYIASNVFSFVDGALLLGGTVTTAAGIVTGVSAGTAPIGVVSNVSIKGQNGLDVARQNIGSLTKREQLANAFRKYTGQIDVEFANTTDLYAAYYADTPMALQLNFSGPALAGTAIPEAFSIICPNIVFNGAPPTTDGPAILKVTAPFDILDDVTDPVIQFNYMSKDTVL